METTKKIAMEELDKVGAFFDENYIDDSDNAWKGVLNAMQRYAEEYHKEKIKEITKINIQNIQDGL